MNPFFNPYLLQLQYQWMSQFGYLPQLNIRNEVTHQTLFNTVLPHDTYTEPQAKVILGKPIASKIGSFSNNTTTLDSNPEEKSVLKLGNNIATPSQNTELYRNIKEYLQIYVDITGFVKITDLEGKLTEYSASLKEFETIHPLLFSKYVLKGKNKGRKD